MHCKFDDTHRMRSAATENRHQNVDDAGEPAVPRAPSAAALRAAANPGDSDA
jgi:hypothetical protein